MSQIDEIKTKLDIVSYIQQYAPLKRAGRTYKACCPFHSEKTPSFVVNPDKQTWRCFGACNEGGDIFSFAQKYHHWNFAEALEELGRLAGVEIRQQSPIERQKDEHKQRLRGLMTAATEYYHQQLLNGSPASNEVLRYAKEKRGFTDETITRYQIGYAPKGWQHLHDELTKIGYTDAELDETGLISKNDAGKTYDRFRNRLIIPIRDEKGRVIAFGARALDPDDQPKYLNSPQTTLFDKSHTLFGLDMAKSTITQSEVAVIVEGYMDAIQAHQAGFLNVVAQMGTALTEHQVKLLAPRYAKKIILALDSDKAGQSATRKSIDVARDVLLSDFNGRMSVDIRVLQIPDAKDPDDLIRESPDGWAELVAHAMTAVQFVIATETAHLPKGIDIRQVPVLEREELAKRILPIISATENETIRRENLQHLATRLYVDYIQLLKWAEHIRDEAVQRKTIRVLPPIPKESHETTTGDEPPPMDLLVLAPPPMSDDGDERVPIPPSENGAGGKSEWDWQPIVLHKPPKPPLERELEAQCLRLLFQSPQMYYQINRKLRSLANFDEILLENQFTELTADDFLGIDYQMLMRLFIDAMAQQDQDPHEYIHANVAPVLQPTLTQIMRDGTLEEMKRVLKNRFLADVEVTARTIKANKTEKEILRETMIVALRLRRFRLLQELQEYKIMLSDFNTQEDAQLVQEVRIRLRYLAKAVGALDRGIHETMQI
ncbi:MAG: DNA primase [Anaerolineae bacterium]|nr:DNA primase [Anaerolineae bacterium]